MEPLFTFHQIYLFQIIKHLPENYRKREMISSVLTLFLLGYPYYSKKCTFPMYLEFLNDSKLSRIKKCS